MPATAMLALVGDRDPNVRAHRRVPGLVDALLARDGLALDAYWVASDEAEADGALDGFDAIWLVPASPYRSEAGALAAVRTAREQGIPFLGTCGGFQHAVLEYARNVCGLDDVKHGENDPDADALLIVPLACSLVGHERAVTVERGTLAERILGVERTVERYHCGFGLNEDYLPILEDAGLRFSGRDEEGDVRILELPDHPFFFATLFQPELAGDGTRPHAVVRAFAAAAVAHAGATAAATASP